MNTTAVRANRQKLAILAALVLLCAAGYMLVGVHFDNAKLFQYAMRIRSPTLTVHPIIDGNESHIIAGKNDFRITTDLQVVPSKTAHVLDDPSAY